MSLTHPMELGMSGTIGGTPNHPASAARIPLANSAEMQGTPSFSGLGSILTKGPLDKGLTWLEHQPRGIELIVEDILGFAVLRSILDTLRGVFYGTDELSWSAGRERILRESFSVVTDIFIPGIVALGLGKLLDKANGGFASSFMSDNHIKVFGQTVKSLKDTASYSEFVHGLAQQLAEARPHERAFKATTASVKDIVAVLKQPMGKVLSRDDIARALNSSAGAAAKKGAFAQSVIDAVMETLPTSEGVMPPSSDALRATLQSAGVTRPTRAVKALRNAYAMAIGERLGEVINLKQMDVAVGRHHVSLPGVAHDMLTLVDHLPADAKGGVGAKVFALPKLRKLIQTTSRNKGIQLVALVAGLVATALAPAVNHQITKKLDNTDDYPALRGLYKKPKDAHVKSEKYQSLLGRLGGKTRKLLDENAPFVMEEIDAGNPLPLAGALLPLVVATGFFDTINRRFRLPADGRFKQLYDYGKVFPYVAQQQIGSLYAILIGARLFSARVDHEYYERVLDSIAGWSIWILGSPFLKQLFAMGTDALNPDKGRNNPLIKSVGRFGRRVLKSVEDIDLMKIPEAEKARLKRKIKLAGRGALVTNILLLGLVEPLMGIFLTKWRADKQQQLAWKDMYQNLRPLEPVVQQQAVGWPVMAR